MQRERSSAEALQVTAFGEAPHRVGDAAQHQTPVAPLQATTSLPGSIPAAARRPNRIVMWPSSSTWSSAGFLITDSV